MKVEQKREVIELVRRSPLPKRHTLAELGVPPSTYYRWQRRFRQQGELGLVDCRPQPGVVWNRLRPQEQKTILTEALRQPDLSPRELACWVTDHAGFSVSESSVYRLLKRHGLIREVQVGRLSRWEGVRKAHDRTRRHETLATPDRSPHRLKPRLRHPDVRSPNPQRRKGGKGELVRVDLKLLKPRPKEGS